MQTIGTISPAMQKLRMAAIEERRRELRQALLSNQGCVDYAKTRLFRRKNIELLVWGNSLLEDKDILLVFHQATRLLRIRRKHFDV